jgi:hypothetical protein
MAKVCCTTLKDLSNPYDQLQAVIQSRGEYKRFKNWHDGFGKHKQAQLVKCNSGLDTIIV